MSIENFELLGMIIGIIVSGIVPLVVYQPTGWEWDDDEYI